MAPLLEIKYLNKMAYILLKIVTFLSGKYPHYLDTILFKWGLLFKATKDPLKCTPN